MPTTNVTTGTPARSALEMIDLMQRANAKIARVNGERCLAAVQRYVEAAGSAGRDLRPKVPRPIATALLWKDAAEYGVDLMQRSILFWDTLRQRGNNWIEHEKAGKPPLLDFEWEIVADARKIERPVNYALARIIAPPGTTLDQDRRPFVIIDPRAGHGPGIGGFKQDSQVGVALKAGHPVYFAIFFPDPEPGQILADVSLAEAQFLRIVRDRHPGARKPVVVGNCQGGWAAMQLGALDPDLPGPIVINGAPMSYWSGNDGENPMRYAGGMLGGAWTALLASDLGGGKFDGAYLVDNFEYLNPSNTYLDKYYNLFAKIDTEPPRFLEFERWWGGYFMMNRQEIKWIVENLFVGNRLSAGEAEWSEGRAFDLREIRSPIILFASLGDNITPPQQAFNWVADLYPTTQALKANGQVIIGLMHKSVGHLGIFVSGQVARREHSQIVDLIEYIERLPPGLYCMEIEEHTVDDEVRYDVVLTERQVEDLQRLQTFARKDEMPFEAVEVVSEKLVSAYEAVIAPALSAMVSPSVAKAMRSFHPQRAQRWLVSDLNPALAPVKGMADFARANRVPRAPDNPFAAIETWAMGMTSAWLDLYRDLRDASVESLFFRTYAPLTIAGIPAERHAAEPVKRDRGEAVVKDALAHIEEGSRVAGLVRIALLLAKAGTGRRRLSAMKQTHELVGRDAGLVDLPPDVARDVVRRQSYIVEFEPARALEALSLLIASEADRAFALDLLDRLDGRIEANADQLALLEKIRGVLGQSVRSSASKTSARTAEIGPDVAEKPQRQRRQSA